MNRYTFRQFDDISKNIKQNEIHLWLYSLNKEFVYHPLNKEEQEKANRFYFSKHKRRYIAAHFGLRTILSRYLNQNPSEIEFSHFAHGKPYLKANNVLKFNLSHSGEWAMLGIGLHHELGVDIEQYSKRSYLDLAKNHFTKDEYQWLTKAPNALKPMLFFQIWAQKEAFIKRSGLGLSRQTNDFMTSKQSGVKISLLDTHDNFKATLHPFMPMPCLAAALCTHQDISDITLFMEAT